MTASTSISWKPLRMRMDAFPGVIFASSPHVEGKLPTQCFQSNAVDFGIADTADMRIAAESRHFDTQSGQGLTKLQSDYTETDYCDTAGQILLFEKGVGCQNSIGKTSPGPQVWWGLDPVARIMLEHAISSSLTRTRFGPSRRADPFIKWSPESLWVASIMPEEKRSRKQRTWASTAGISQAGMALPASPALASLVAP